MMNLFLDFETYYDDEYSLRKMTPPEYVADPRFEALNCSFAFNDETPFVVEGPDLPKFLAPLPWDQIRAISHNALFDMMVLSMQYKMKPARYGDTMCMARNWLMHMTGRISVDAISKFYGLPAKWDTLARTKGVTYAMLKANPVLHKETNDYAVDDLIKCRTFWHKMLADGFPEGELDVIDMVIRMAAQPKFVLDMEILSQHLHEVKQRKQDLLDRAGLENRDNLMQDAAFAAMLLFAGCTPPMKVSKTTGKEMYAFAKTDKEFKDLLEHDNPDVQALVAARLGHKSTQEETRTQHFIDIGRVCSSFPIPLKYSGAHTHRFSGDWSLNGQNLSRFNKKVPGSGRLRTSLKAPKGKAVISVDASQIEARLNAVLSGETMLVEAFRRKEDVYSTFAERIYHHPVNKVDFPDERFVGKTGILSLGYGSSWPVFQAMCRNQGGVELNAADASAVVGVYRGTYTKIVENWRFADQTILPILAGHLAIGGADGFQWGPVLVKKYEIILPNGNRLRYRDMVREWDEKTNRMVWKFMRGTRPVWTYGAKIVENVVQAIAFVHIMEVAKRVAHMTQYQLLMAHQVHDELIYVEDEKLAPQIVTLVVQEMSKSPWWMPDAPLAAEGGFGVSYGEAK